MHDSEHVNDLVQELDEHRKRPRHLSLNNNGCHQLVQELHLWDLVGLLNSNSVGATSLKHNREVQHFVDESNPGHPMENRESGCRT